METNADGSALISEIHSLKREFGEDFTVNLGSNNIRVGLNLKSLTENEMARESVVWINVKEKLNIEFNPRFEGSDAILEELNQQVSGVNGLKQGLIRKVYSKMFSMMGNEPMIMKTVSHLNHKEDFTILNQIGAGSFGRVFLCKSILDGNNYAIKEILFDKTQYNRVIREVETLSMMEHPNIVRYYQSWVDDTGKSLTLSSDSNDATLYIVMGYYEKTLKDIIKENNEGLGTEQVLKYLHQIMTGVKELHDKGIIHGDLSPANIFVDEKNNIRIGDFGLARKLNLGMKYYRPSVDHGNKLYQAPEIKGVNSEFTTQIDTYAVGLILLEMAHPIRDFVHKVEVFKEARKKVLPGSLPRLLRLLIAGLLLPEPTARSTAQDVLNFLAEIV